MKRPSCLLVASLGIAAASIVGAAQSRPPEKPNFSGNWTLNRELSDEPRPARSQRPPSGDPRRGDGGGGRGRFGGGIGGRGGFGGGLGGGRYGAGRAGANDEARATLQELVAAARLPSQRLTIYHSAANIAVTDSSGRTRFFQTNGSRDKHQLDAGTVDSTTRWAGDQLVTDYDLGNGRRMTCTYALVPDTRQLVVRIRFDGAGAGPPIKYVYDVVRTR